MARRTYADMDRSLDLVRFGTFTLDMTTGELRKYGIRLRLQGKSFEILKALLERPGRVVTREELRKRLWPQDTFVDFESGLNTAVNRLRSALGDSAARPAYVETLARLGYRFVGDVDANESEQLIAEYLDTMTRQEGKQHEEQARFSNKLRAEELRSPAEHLRYQHRTEH